MDIIYKTFSPKAKDRLKPQSYHQTSLNNNNKENQEILKNKVNKLSNYIKKLSKVKEDASLINSLWIDLEATKNVSIPHHKYKASKYNILRNIQPFQISHFSLSTILNSIYFRFLLECI